MYVQHFFILVTITYGHIIVIIFAIIYLKEDSVYLTLINCLGNHLIFFIFANSRWTTHSRDHAGKHAAHVRAHRVEVAVPRHADALDSMLCTIFAVTIIACLRKCSFYRSWKLLKIVQICTNMVFEEQRYSLMFKLPILAVAVKFSIFTLKAFIIHHHWKLQQNIIIAIVIWCNFVITKRCSSNT